MSNQRLLSTYTDSCTLAKSQSPRLCLRALSGDVPLEFARWYLMLTAQRGVLNLAFCGGSTNHSTWRIGWVNAHLPSAFLCQYLVSYNLLCSELFSPLGFVAFLPLFSPAWAISEPLSCISLLCSRFHIWYLLFSTLFVVAFCWLQDNVVCHFVSEIDCNSKVPSKLSLPSEPF